MDHHDGPTSVTGGGQYYSDARGFWITVGVHALRDADGVKGTFHLRAHADQGRGSIIGGEIVCLSTMDNHAWMAGYILRWRRGPTEYTPVGFMVVDNGEGEGSSPDEIRFNWGLQGGLPPFASPEDWCTRQPQDSTFPVRGNFQIHH